jgi:hypothetical protein
LIDALVLQLVHQLFNVFVAFHPLCILELLLDATAAEVASVMLVVVIVCLYRGYECGGRPE